MSKFLAIFKWFPYVLAGVVAVEGAVVPGTPGKTKKSIILGSITSVAAVGEQVPDSTVSVISSLIDSVVGELNASGVFNHGIAPAAPV
jgi:hypothetical protein